MTTASSSSTEKSASDAEMTRNKKFNSILRVLEGKNDVFLNRLREIHTNTGTLYQSASAYDFSPSVPANGLRSIIQMICMMFDHIELLVHHQQVRKNQEILHEWETLSKVFLKITQMCLLILERDQKFKAENVRSDSSSYTEIDEKLLESTFEITEQGIRPIYSMIGFFWLRKGFEKEFRKLITLSVLARSSQIFKLLLNNDMMINESVHQSQNCTITGIRKGLDVFTKFPFSQIAGIKWNGKGSVKGIEIPKQKDWVIHVRDSQTVTQVIKREDLENQTDLMPISDENDDGRVGSQNDESTGEKRVTGLLIGRDNSSTRNGISDRCVILHLHGGAFVACQPIHHVNYLKMWSRSLGVPVICPNYAKAPENPFPDGLQDCLDTYLFLTSGHDRVADMIGFRPDRIILSGDSAGGWFAVALTFVLSQMAKSDSKIRMPSGIVIQYPAVNLSFSIDASQGISILDPLLTSSLNCLCLSVYAKRDTLLQGDSWPNDPQVRKKIPKLMTVRMSDPLFNLLAFKRWQDLKQIPLFVTACEYDPLLDGAISLCKSWQGPVELDIARGLAHGFLFLPPDHTRHDFDQVINRFRQCISSSSSSSSSPTSSPPSSPSSSSSSSSSPSSVSTDTQIRTHAAIEVTESIDPAIVLSE